MSEAVNLNVEPARRPKAPANDLPASGLHVADPADFAEKKILEKFAKLRAQDPVHYVADSPYGPYWAITRYDDIIKVDTSHDVFSSAAALGGIVIDDAITKDEDVGFQFENFIAMDQPRHYAQRKAVQPIAASPSVAELSELVRTRTQEVLDSLPVGEPFDWVSTVSIELTTRMLATLFDFPFEDRAKLTRWSDVTTAEVGSPLIESQEARVAELMECYEYFVNLWNQRVDQPPKFDLISMMANDPDTKNMEPMLFLGNLLLLIVGGNDTTRNTMSASVYALNKFPDQYDLLRSDHSLIDRMVAEVIRWQTPLSHMRRTCIEDTELSGKQIKKGDKVVMWYYSGNRDEDVFPEADKIDIMRPNVRSHLSFGYGIHRCMGLRLAEMQLRILWEEILKRWTSIEVLEEPDLVLSNFVNGYSKMMVKINP